MDDMTLKRLLIAKRLFIHGEMHSNNNTELDRFIAIHHFDNAVELFLKIIATNEGVLSSIKKDLTFKELWGEINVKLKAKTSPYELPLKDQIVLLHEARNLAQHQGDAPSYEVVTKNKGYVRDFFDKCYKDIFNIRFDEIHSSMLVNDMDIKGYLIEAEKQLDINDFERSIESSGTAFAYIKQKERMSSENKKLRRIITFGLLHQDRDISLQDIHCYNQDKNTEKIYREVNNQFKMLKQEIKKILENRSRNLKEFAEAIEDELAVLKLGVDYKAFINFRNIIPYVYFTIDEKPHIIMSKKEGFTKEEALLCYEFVLEAVIRLQSVGI